MLQRFRGERKFRHIGYHVTLLKSIAFGKMIWPFLEFLLLYWQLHCLTGAVFLWFSVPLSRLRKYFVFFSLSLYHRPLERIIAPFVFYSEISSLCRFMTLISSLICRFSIAVTLTPSNLFWRCVIFFSQIFLFGWHFVFLLSCITWWTWPDFHFHGIP